MRAHELPLAGSFLTVQPKPASAIEIFRCEIPLVEPMVTGTCASCCTRIASPAAVPESSPTFAPAIVAEHGPSIEPAAGPAAASEDTIAATVRTSQCLSRISLASLWTATPLAAECRTPRAHGHRGSHGSAGARRGSG